jgi:4-hydroxy-tetrahydrodipicolinate reductase
LLPEIGIIGAGGRLGGCLCALAAELGYTVSLQGRRQSWEIRGVPQVLIDVSHPSAFPEVAAYCLREGIPLVEGVSGLPEEHLAGLRRLSQRVAVVRAANFAFGHFLQRALLEHLAGHARRWPGVGELSVQERHPAHKKDRPSATARELGGLWSALSGRPVADVASIRGGLPVSDHEVTFTLAGELLSVRHCVTDRTVAARGALRAASWVQRRGPGLWGMTDVYGEEPDHPDLT